MFGCVGHDLNRCMGGGKSEVLMLNGVGERTPPCFKLISICCVSFSSLDVVCEEPNDCAWNVCL